MGALAALLAFGWLLAGHTMHVTLPRKVVKQQL